MGCLTSCHHGRSRFEDGEVSATDPEVLDGELHEARDPSRRELWSAADNGSGRGDGDRWLLAHVVDSVRVDWHTWFGTLCVVLWLLVLIIL